jgi:hypothetical protein
MDRMAKWKLQKRDRIGSMFRMAKSNPVNPVILSHSGGLGNLTGLTRWTGCQMEQSGTNNEDKFTRRAKRKAF